MIWPPDTVFESGSQQRNEHRKSQSGQADLFLEGEAIHSSMFQHVSPDANPSPNEKQRREINRGVKVDVTAHRNV